jgi:hypothetical protein
VLQRFAKPSHLFAKVPSLVVGYFALQIVWPKYLSWEIEPFRAARLRPAQIGVVTALLSKERFAPSCFLFPRSLTKLGLNLAKEFLE